MAEFSMNGPASRTARRAGWALAAFAVVVMIVLGASRTPVAGDSPERLRHLAEQLKCLQCQGETVASASSDFAVKMREAVAAEMRLGKTDDEIFTAMVNTYGERVLLTPRATGIAAFVWIVPVVVAVGGVAGLGMSFASARARREESTTLQVSAEDAAKVEQALAGDDH